MQQRLGPGAVLALGTIGALLLTGCAAGSSIGGRSAPTWVPKPSFQGEGLPPGAGASGGNNPGVPGPGGPAVPGQPAPSGSSGPATDPAVVATKLHAPTGIAVLPDTTALVGERTTGRIVDVQPKPGQPVTAVRTLAGLDTSGDGGLLDLALSPHYDQDGLIYAYVTTATDNRVVTFTRTGPVTPVVVGIPKGQTGNGGRIAFGPDGDLYIGTGNAGDPALAQNPRSLAGKVLRVSDIGQPAEGNPSATSPVYTRGHHALSGLCALPSGDAVIEVEPRSAAATGDEVNVLAPGEDYGYPVPAASSAGPVVTLPAATPAPGGCAVLGSRLYVTSLDGRSLLTAALVTKNGAVSAGSFSATLKNKYGRLLTVVAAPDGALWLTTSNRDGHGTPVAADERVLRIVPSAAGGTSPV